MADTQDPQVPAQLTASPPSPELILRALHLWDETHSKAQNISAAINAGMGDWLDKPKWLLEKLQPDFNYDDKKDLLENLKHFASEGADTVVTSAAILIPAALAHFAYQNRQALTSSEMRNLVSETPSVLVSGLTFVQKMRISAALATIAETPEGARLVESLHAAKTPVELYYGGGIGGGNLGHETFVEDGAIMRKPTVVQASALSTHGTLVEVLAHELRHHEQTMTGVIAPYLKSGVVSPESAFIYNRFMEADAQATATDIAWQLKQRGQPAAWTELTKEQTWLKPIADAFEAAIEADPAALTDGRAKRAAFDAWFTTEVTPGGVRMADFYNKQGVELLPQQSVVRSALEQGATLTGDMTPEEFAQVAGNNGDNYLTRTGGRRLDDPFYREVRGISHADKAELLQQNAEYEGLRGKFNSAAGRAPQEGPMVIDRTSQQITRIVKNEIISMESRGRRIGTEPDGYLPTTEITTRLPGMTEDITVVVPSPDFKRPAVAYEQATGLTGISTRYQRPVDVTSSQLESFTTALWLKHAKGWIEGTQRRDLLAMIYNELEVRNPELKTLKFDHTNVEQLHGVINGVASEFNVRDIQFFIDGNTHDVAMREPAYAAKFAEAGSGAGKLHWVPAPETLDAIKAQVAATSAGLTPPAAPKPRPTLTNADVQFILEGDYALRHVSSRRHMDQHFTGEVYGDAVPLTGMGRIILDQMAAEGAIPKRNGTNIPELMATHGDAIRARFEAALAKNIAGSVAMDGGGSSHFMIVKGMKNAVESSYIGESGYPFGKAGKQDIRPEQVLSSAGVEAGDIGRIAQGGHISEVLHDRVVESIRGLRTGEATLVSDVRRDGSSRAGIPNGLLEPGHAPPAVQEWTLEVLRAVEGDVNATKLNTLAQQALAADPAAALRAVTDIAKLGRDVPQPLLEAMPRWTESALHAVEATDPGGAFSMAQQIGDNLPSGDPLHTVTNNALASAARRLAATDPLDALNKVAFAAEFLQDGDPRMKTLIDAYSEVYEVARRAEPEAVSTFIERQRHYVSPESDYGKLLAEKAAQPGVDIDPANERVDTHLMRKPVAGTPATADAVVTPPAEVATVPAETAVIPGGMSMVTKVNTAIDGGMGALGLVQGTMGAIRAAKEGDELGVVVNGANAVSGGTALTMSVARGLGYEVAPALGSIVTHANIALTVGTGLYQIGTEKGNFIDTEADGSHNLGNKGERTVAVVATGVAAAGMIAAGVGSMGVVPAVVAVAVVGDKAIEARRAWKDVDRQIVESGAPHRRDVHYPGEDGSPDMRKFKHIFVEMLEVSKDMRDSALPFKPERDPQTGRIKFDEARKLDLKDPKVMAEFERALELHIQRQQQVMKDNDSVLPKWLRFDDGGSKYTVAQMILSDLQGAKTELGWLKSDIAAWDAAHPGASSRFVPGQSAGQAPVVTATKAQPVIIPRNTPPQGPRG